MNVADVLVGARYALDMEKLGFSNPATAERVAPALGLEFILKARVGSGPSVVIDAEPISGPIVRKSYEEHSQGIALRYFAVCQGCGGYSPKNYMNKNSAHLLRWAHLHRCSTSNVASR